VPELSHDTAEDGFHEIQLSGKQLVFLFIVTTSVVVGVFLFGVLVGRGARDTGSAEPPAETTAAPAPAPVAGSGSRPVEPPNPVDESEKLSYNNLLTGKPSSPDTLKAPEPKPATENPVPSDGKATSPTAAAKVPEAKPEPPAPAPAPKSPAASGGASSARPGTWLVQVIATRDAAMATSVVKKLDAKGYPAFLVNPVAGAPQPFYKVQVGRYDDRSEAEKVSQRLKKEEQFKSWILR
jgi:septal ring-binding cell division protein DamX